MRIKSLSWDDTHHLRNFRCSILTILGSTLRIQKPSHQVEYPNKVYITFRMRNSQTILSWTQNKMYKNNIICKLYTRKCEKNNSPKSTLSFRLAKIILSTYFTSQFIFATIHGFYYTFWVLFMSLTILFQLIFTFMYNTFSKMFSVSVK